MNDSDQRWKEKWSRTFFNPPVHDFANVVSTYASVRGFSLFGSDQEPQSTIWLASLSEALGEHFREGLAVLDYGCGAGRYCNFLGQRLKTFTYYGVEKRGSWFRHGEKSIRVANRMFRQERRARFGFIGSDLEREGIQNVHAVILGSILTHVDFDEATRILAKVQPVVARGGTVVFSGFTADTYRVEGPGAYGLKDCYSRVWFTRQQIAQLADQTVSQVREAESFLAQGVNLHRIFSINKHLAGQSESFPEDSRARFVEEQTPRQNPETV